MLTAACQIYLFWLIHNLDYVDSLLLHFFVYTFVFFVIRKMNAFLGQFESKSKHSTVSREAAAAAAVTSNDSQSEYTLCF